MRLSARVDYAIRAVVELAARTDPDAAPTGAALQPSVRASELAAIQDISPKYLEGILLSLRQGGVVAARRGSVGGYRLARPAKDISLADIIRIVDGPLTNIRGFRPEQLDYVGPAATLQMVWIALRARERQILEGVTVAEIVRNDLPERVRSLTRDPRAWH
ncbi:Rrf2 family protein [Asanoa hainanensis]|uniref:Rrf2 family protein n=1 Tax=Asanoa hainanensis TaxID=560556 RepID=A0A239P3S1_9ACTN|nr:Rrf2 family transcriptional regulator [Asanoa hainanensis]SNT60959.1 Rrf2 family protein [Asanoa hainanensis]